MKFKQFEIKRPGGSVKLSPSEMKVKNLLLEGLPNSKIAKRIGVVEKTVKFHLTNIFAKEEVQSRTQLIAKYKKKFETNSAKLTPEEMSAWKELFFKKHE